MKILKYSKICLFFAALGVSILAQGQEPTVSISLDRAEIQEAHGEATLTATLSKVYSKDVILTFRTQGAATYNVDFMTEFTGKGTSKTIAGISGQSGAGANQLNNPTAIIMDKEGTLFIVDSGNHRVQKWLPGAKKGITVAGGNGAGAASNQLYHPQGIAVDKAGNLYISDTHNHRIQKWAPGATEGVTIAGGNGSGSDANQLFYPMNITLDDNENLFIVDYSNARVQKWVPGATAGITVAGGNGQGVEENKLFYPTGISIDKLGNIYVVSNHSVVKWTPGASRGIQVAGNYWSGDELDLLQDPIGIYFDEAGNLFIADTGNHRIQKWAVNVQKGITIAGGKGAGSNPNQFFSPTSVFTDRFEDLYISDNDNHRIQKLLIHPQIVIPAGQLSGSFRIVALEDSNLEDNEDFKFDLETIENATLASPQTTWSLIILDDDLPPTASFSLSDSTLTEEGEPLAIDIRLTPHPQKKVSAKLRFSGSAQIGKDYTVDHQEVVFQPGDSVKTIHIKPINDELVESMETIQIEVVGGENLSTSYPSVIIFVSSDDKPSVQVALDKTSISEANGKATFTATLSHPHSRDVILYFDHNGTAQFENDYTLNFNEKGSITLVAGGNGAGSDANQLHYPTNVKMDQDGNLVIADYFNSRIQLWKKGASSGITLAKSYRPIYIALDSLNNLYVSDDYNHFVKKWTHGDTVGIIVAGGNGYGPNANQLNHPTGLTVDSQGNLFIAVRGNLSIQKWVPGAGEGITIVNKETKISPEWQCSPFQTNVFLDQQNNIYYGCHSYGSIIKWSPESNSGQIVAGGNFMVDPPLSISSPYHFTLDKWGNIYLNAGGMVLRWVQGERSGVIVAGKSEKGDAMDQLNDQKGMFVGPNGDIYIADSGNNRILKILQAPQIRIPAGQITGKLEIIGLEDSILEPNEQVTFQVNQIDNGFLLQPNAKQFSITLLDEGPVLVKDPNINLPALSNTATSWGDFDRDGDLDLAILGFNQDEGAMTRIYRNDNGHLVDSAIPLTQFVSGDLKWTDLNQDGFLDLLVTGLSALGENQTELNTIVYLNQKGQGFSPITNLGIENLLSPKIALGDLDKDGDEDLVMLGYNSMQNPVLNVYKYQNHSAVFSRLPNFDITTLENEKNWDVKIIDYDSDGDLDIMFSGSHNWEFPRTYGIIHNKFSPGKGEGFYFNLSDLTYEVLKLDELNHALDILGVGYDDNQPAFKSNRTGILFEGEKPNLKDADLAVGDFNHDGLNDLIVSGRDILNKPKVFLYAQKPKTPDYKEIIFSQVSNTDVSALYHPKVEWVDYNSDGYLDLVMTGLDENNTQKTYFYKNQITYRKNERPAPPSNLRVIDKGYGNVEFKWDKPQDDHSRFFGYRIRIGTTPGGDEITQSFSILSTGSQLVSGHPPLFLESYLKQLNPGRYYWSVQAIDQSFQGSMFAKESILELKYDWKLNRQVDVIDHSFPSFNIPKFMLIDVENDNDLDLIYFSEYGGKYFKLNKGEYVIDQNFNPRDNLENLEANDVNNDGFMDFAISSNYHGMGVYLNRGGISFEPLLLTDKVLKATKMKITDMNNNGRKEILIAGMTSSLSDGVPKLYSFEFDPETQTFIFRDESPKIAALKNAVYDFGDFDKDGRVDFILSGSGNLGVRTILYRNITVPGGPLALSATNITLPRITKGAIHFLDYDADGDEDLIFIGRSTTGTLFHIYANEFDQGLGFVPKTLNLEPIEDAKVSFVDINGDGYTDIFYSGLKLGIGKISRLAQYNPNSKDYDNRSFDFGNLFDVSVSAGDIDADGDVDLVIAGFHKDNPSQKIQYALFNVHNDFVSLETSRNQEKSEDETQKSPISDNLTGSTYLFNTPPKAPLHKSLTTALENSTQILRFVWNPATDDNTPSKGLTYSLRVGTTPTNNAILASHANLNGTLTKPAIGNVSTNTAWNLQMLPDGEYYWSVQAIDASFVGGPFSIPQKFTIQNGRLSTVPNQPDDFLSSQPFVCPNSTFTYTLPSAEEGATYEWGFLEASPGAKIIATTATSATVFFETGFSEATLTVLAKNAFGESPKRSFKIRKGTLPNTPGTIQASHLVVCQNSTRSYTVLPVDGALSYEWSYSGTGASFSNGGESIRVSYGASATSGTWQVRAVGGCGSSEPRTLPVQMIPQNQLVQGPLTLRAAERRNEQATRSIILQPGASQQPITLEHGTVFSAQLVGCPVE
ncbi:MAG: FG-GAP-like repeat-containing protein [Spirosomataceae bacterium]